MGMNKKGIKTIRECEKNLVVVVVDGKAQTIPGRWSTVIFRGFLSHNNEFALFVDLCMICGSMVLYREALSSAPICYLYSKSHG